MVAVIVLGLLIFVHELGHFIVAKRTGVGVKVFSLGFGPALINIRRGQTDYRLSIIPLGGYVRMVGEEPDEEVAPQEIPRSFTHKPVGVRMAIVAAGPAANVVFALITYYLVLVLWGLPILAPSVGKVVKASPAQAAGLRPGDEIVAIDGKKITRWSDMVSIIQASKGRALVFRVRRGHRELSVVVRPRPEMVTDIFGETQRIYRVGIIASGKRVIKRVGVFEAAQLAFTKAWVAAKLIGLTVVKLVQAKVSVKELGGPIFIAQAAGQMARYGLAPLMDFAALISVNLAVINLLPFPPLDGGHLLLFGIEAIRRRPLPLKARQWLQQVGLALVLLLMIVVFYNDIARIITGGR